VCRRITTAPNGPLEETIIATVKATTTRWWHFNSPWMLLNHDRRLSPPTAHAGIRNVLISMGPKGMKRG
jgi:hypothetical protein